jgi:hypothetical protein
MRFLAIAAVLGGCAAGHGVTGADASAGGPDAARSGDGPAGDASFPATLGGARDRLLASYYAWLETQPTVMQSNGLVGEDLASVCDLWNGLDPSSQSVFLTITHRLYGSILATDGSRMLDHVVTLYRVIGGQGATAADPGTCGGGEYNRMIMHEDAELQAAQLAANGDQGATPYDLADVVSTSYWRDSHDLGGPHAPFDLSDETNSGESRQ